jgi:hypothetical protein
MNKLIIAFGVGWLGVTASARAASGEGGRLLVVVEGAPGEELAADDVRQTIAAELGAPVLGPGEGGAPARVLVVALGRGEIRMALHVSPVAAVARTIPAPAERPARLRAIGWLAGNLARDQVTAIVARVTESELEPALASAAVAEPPARAATEPPPPSAVPPSAATAAIATRPAAPAGSTGEGSTWSITLAGGPAAQMSFPGTPLPWQLYVSPSYQVEIERSPAPGGLLVGVALDVGTNNPTSFLDREIGVAGFVGSSWRSRRLFAETTAGLGIQALELPITTNTFTQSSVSGTMSSTTVGGALSPVLYARGVAGVGMAIGRSLDAVARISGYLGSSGLERSYASATVGVRFRLP